MSATRKPRFYDRPADGRPVVDVPIDNRDGAFATFDQDFYLDMLKRYGKGFRVILNGRIKNGFPPEYVRIPEPPGENWRVKNLQAAWIVLDLWPGDGKTVKHKDNNRQNLCRDNLMTVPKGQGERIFSKALQFE